MNEVEFIAFLVRACALLARFSADDSLHFVFMDWRHLAGVPIAGNVTGLGAFLMPLILPLARGWHLWLPKTSDLAAHERYLDPVSKCTDD